MRPVLLSAYTMSSCLGRGLGPTRAAMRAGRSGLTPCRFETVALDTFVGEIPDVDSQALPDSLALYDCRNNRAAEAGLRQDGFVDAVEAARARHSPARIGVFIGTSTAGVLQTELAYRRRDPGNGSLPADFDYRHTHNTSSVADYVRERSGLEGRARRDLHGLLVERRLRLGPRVSGSGTHRRGRGRGDTLCLTTLRIQLPSCSRHAPAVRRLSARRHPSTKARRSPTC
jgi:3-oxoacyl-[acyl-carrier-protein] synthase-1